MPLQLRTLGVTDLRSPGGEELSAVVRQPKRFALLTYLALAATGRYVRRDTLLSLFWPELDQEHARAALRRSLYFLRKAGGDELITGRGEDEVGVPAGVLWCDAVAFLEARKAGQDAEALALYQGAFLEGFYVAGGPDVEDWIDRERTRLASEARDAARRLARGARDADAVSRWAHRALEIDPDDATMRELLERRRTTAAAPLPEPAAPRPADPELIAICPFAVRGHADLGFLGEGIVDLLATKLDGAGTLRVVEPRLVLSGITNAGETWDVARGRWLASRAGAGSFVLGSVVESAGRLEATAALHAVDGALVARVEGRADSEGQLFELVDEVARRLLAARAATAPERLARLAALTTTSLTALKQWLEGEHRFRQGDAFGAADSFQRATVEDPSFALAWYRLAATLAASGLGEPARQASERASAHRERLSEHDRLLFEAQHAWLRGRSAEAERRYAELVTGWPESLDGWFLLGDAQFHSNPYRGRSIAQSRPAFEHALALDPGHLASLTQLARIAALESRHSDLDALVTRGLAIRAQGEHALGLRALRAWALNRTDEQPGLTRELTLARGLTIAKTFSDVALYTGNLARAAELGRALFAAARSEEFRAFGLITLAHLDLARGLTTEAFDRLREAERLEPAWALTTRGLFASQSFVKIPLEQRRTIRQALADWDPDSARLATAIPLAFHNGLHAHLRTWLLGMLAVRLDDLDAATAEAEALAELEVPDQAAALLTHLGRTLRAELLRARGKPADALAVVSQHGLDVWFQYAVSSPFYAGTFERYLRAELLAEAGRFPEAIQWWEAIAQRTPFELPFLAPALTRQAETWQALGDDERARQLRGRIGVLWGTGVG